MVSNGGLCVDRSAVAGYDGYVREVTITKGLLVVVEFNPYDLDEGGPRYTCQYPDLDTVLNALERYFGRPFAEWENYDATGNYPDEPEGWTG